MNASGVTRYKVSLKLRDGVPVGNPRTVDPRGDMKFYRVGPEYFEQKTALDEYERLRDAGLDVQLTEERLLLSSLPVVWEK